jgi:hypothetical protein
MIRSRFVLLQVNRTIIEHCSALRILAAEARPLPACSALPPSAPEPPTLTPQPGKEVFTRGQKQGGSGLRVPVRRLLQVVAKTAPPAAAPAARAVAGVAALRPSRGARASTPPPTGARKLGFKPVLFLLLGLVLILRFLLDGSL